MKPSAPEPHPDYPLLLEPRFDAKIWGGRRLETVLGKSLPGDERYGESLESDSDSLISNGPLRGTRLSELIRRSPRETLGIRGLRASDNRADLPLLAKFIDASDVLSIQVHPDDEGARRLGKRGKTEAWHIVSAEPGSELVTGIITGASIETVRDAIESGTLEKLLIRTPVATGDTLYIRAGTTHAIGAGILLYEIQQTSDVTFRMFDWNRLDDREQPRDLHIAESLEAVRLESQAEAASPLRMDDNRELLVACQYFALERWRISRKPVRFEFDGESFRLFSIVKGILELDAGNGAVAIKSGQTVLLPATVKAARFSGDCTALVSYVPDLSGQLLPALISAGHESSGLASTIFDTPGHEP